MKTLLVGKAKKKKKKHVLCLALPLPHGGREGKGGMRIQWTFLEVCLRDTDHSLPLVLCWTVPCPSKALHCEHNILRSALTSSGEYSFGAGRVIACRGKQEAGSRKQEGRMAG